MVSSSETIGLVADHLDFVVEALDKTIIDRHMKPCQDIFFMAAKHPGELTERHQTAYTLPTRTIAANVFWPKASFVRRLLARKSSLNSTFDPLQ